MVRSLRLKGAHGNHVGMFRHLRRVDLTCCGLDIVRALHGHDLQEIKLVDCGIDEETLSGLSADKICVRDSCCADVGNALDHVRAETLDIQCWGNSTVKLTGVKYLKLWHPCVKSLDLSDCPLKTAELNINAAVVLPECIEELTATNFYSDIGHCKQLHTLQLSSTSVPARDVGRLRVLKTCRWTIDDVSLHYLDMSIMHTLHLDHSAVSDVGITILATKKLVLKDVSLECTSVTECGLMALARTCKLERVRVTWCDVAPEGYVELPESVTSLSTGVRIQDNAIHEGLTELRAPYSRLTARACSRMQNMRYLDLTGCEIRDKGLYLLAKCILLEHLDIASCGCTDKGVVALVLPLLRYLDIADNNVTDVGVLALRKCPNLKEIDLTGTRVTSGGILRMDQFLRST